MMKFLTFFTLPAPLKRFLWAICTLLGTGLFATLMVQPFDPNFSGWQLLWYTLKNDARGGSPHIQFVLLMMVEILLMISAMMLVLAQRIHVMLMITFCFLFFFWLNIGRTLWLSQYDSFVFVLLCFLIASYCLPERNEINHIYCIINGLSLIYVLWIVMKMPLQAA